METIVKKSFFQSTSTQVTLKLIMIGILTLFLLIPKFMILGLVDERQNLSASVINEVSEGWANEQVVTGPVLVIPYNVLVPNDDKTKVATKMKYNMLVYPELLQTNGIIETKSKHRNLYQVLLYTSKMKVQGNFILPELSQWDATPENILYDQAYMAMGISDLKGIENKIIFRWNNDTLGLSPSMIDVSVKVRNMDITEKEFRTGLHTKVAISPTEREYHFDYALDLKGSKSLQFAPLAKTNEVHLSSDFTDPKFVGGFLPEHITNKEGFDANWKILEYNKILPPFQKNNNVIQVENNLFGVAIQPILDNYATTYRAGKYMILIVALTFLVVFLTEVLENVKIHIFQYTLIGLSLAIFFTLLLSISEFVGFNKSYFVSAAATILLLFLYSLGLFKNRKSSFILLTLLVSLFGYIFLIIQLEKAALLAGSVGLFAIIASTMYVTRKIKWFEGANEEQIHSTEPAAFDTDENE